jgi:class 3 adenylate cyclase
MYNESGVDYMADKALIGFLKVLVEINRDRQLISYRSDKRLAAASGAFRLRMGFGLHSGWAIEGAVGSVQKVDATYLSPHVNMAARMEAASRQFKLAILMTQQFHEVCSFYCMYCSSYIEHIYNSQKNSKHPRLDDR